MRDRPSQHTAGVSRWITSAWQRIAPSSAFWGRFLIMRLLPNVSAPLTTAVACCVLVSALIPLAFTVASGQLVGAVPQAVHGGFASAAGRRALFALAVLALLFITQQTVAAVRGTLAGMLGRDLDQHLDERVMRALHGPSGVGHLEDPAVIDSISIAQGLNAGNNTPGNAAIALTNKAPLWLQSVGYALVLARFHWWFAMGLLTVYVIVAEVRRRDYIRSAQVVTNQAQTLRRAGYFCDIALTDGAAKEVRIYRLGDWLIDRYRASWWQAMAGAWRDRQQANTPVLLMTALFVLAQSCVLGASGWAGVNGAISLAALTVYAGAVFGMAGFLALGSDDYRLA